MVNTRQFSGSTYMQDMDKKSHIFSQKSGVDLYADSTYTPRNTVHVHVRYYKLLKNYCCVAYMYSIGL